MPVDQRATQVGSIESGRERICPVPSVLLFLLSCGSRPALRPVQGACKRAPSCPLPRRVPRRDQRLLVVFLDGSRHLLPPSVPRFASGVPCPPPSSTMRRSSARRVRSTRSAGMALSIAPISSATLRARPLSISRFILRCHCRTSSAVRRMSPLSRSRAIFPTITSLRAVSTRGSFGMLTAFTIVRRHHRPSSTSSPPSAPPSPTQPSLSLQASPARLRASIAVSAPAHTSQPPSTAMCWPVIWRASSLARNSTALAMSCATVTRRSAMSRTYSS